jgi:hypothetical protein
MCSQSRPARNADEMAEIANKKAELHIDNAIQEAYIAFMVMVRCQNNAVIGSPFSG